MLSVLPLPAFTDNYIWLVHDRRLAIAVDPGDAGPVSQAEKKLGLELLGILNTHHHADHTGGNLAPYQRYDCAIYAPASAPIPALTHPLGDGDRIRLPELQLRVQVITTPGHTLDHISLCGPRLSVLWRHRIWLRLRQIVRRQRRAMMSPAV